jgi:hypothetical protein
MSAEGALSQESVGQATDGREQQPPAGESDGDDLSPRGRRMLSGLTGERFDCQTGREVHTPLDAPWRGAYGERAKTLLFEYVRSESKGVRISKIVSDVFGQDAVDSAGADYQLARRFFERWDMFKTDRRDRNLWVEPRFGVFHLSTQYAERKTSGQDGDGLSTVETGGQTGDGGSADNPTGDEDVADLPEPHYPKDRVRSILSKRTLLNGSDGRHDYRAELLGELATERENVADKFSIFERVRGQGSDYLLIPYTTRFNSRDRATDTQGRFRTALRTAAEEYSDAVVLTVTVDPKGHESLSAALESLTENKGRLLSWLSTDYQLGHRPENLSVLEFMENGLPHAHIVLFGRSWLMHQNQLSAKWADLGTGSVVDVRTARNRGEEWFMHNDDGGTVTLQQYLGKAIRGLADLADMDEAELRDAVDAGEVADLWKHALYWATERQYCSCSPALKQSDDDGLPHVTEWRFRGVARYEDIPAHVTRDAAMARRQGRPPPGD